MRRHIFRGVLPGFAIVSRAQFRSKRLRVSSGSFALTGMPVSFLTGSAHVLTAGPGAYALTGQSAALLRGRRLAAGAGAFALTGSNATLTAGTIPKVALDTWEMMLFGRDRDGVVGAILVHGKTVGVSIALSETFG